MSSLDTPRRRLPSLACRPRSSDVPPVSLPGMAIVPDTKDWTWVLTRACPECGFDARSFPREEVAERTRGNAARWRELLAGRDDLRTRPAPGTWSPLEYACHVRDVFTLFDERLRLMLTLDDPLFPNWDQDETAVAERYGEQDPAEVAVQLGRAGDAVAARFASVAGEQWARTGSRGDGARFTVESFARYFLHDPVHHLYDVTRRRHIEP
jgi:hypothetical protein